MAQAVAVKRPGNPNFVKKVTKPEREQHKEEAQKVYIFQLLKEYTRTKPLTSKLGEDGGRIENPFQPWYGVVNSGIAWDNEYTPKGKTKPGGQRRWRFLFNYPDTIWVDEQIDPEPVKEDFADSRNDIVFRNGYLRVYAHEERKLQALMLNDTFEGNARPLKDLPAEYKLLDQDKVDREVLQMLDDAFEAEKAAREASLEEMYALCIYYGINLERSDDAIRKEFIQRARTSPSQFNREFVNPKNKYKYTFLCAISANLISGTMIPGKLQYVETNVPLFDLKTEDTAEELATLCMGNYEKAVNLYNKLKKRFEEEEKDVS